jgi:ATP-dependent Clp endopeptidase proteolytic subunit ClpP
MIFQVQDNTIIAHGEIWDGNGMQFVTLFSQLEANYGQITVKLHSYGGSVFDGNLIYNTIQNSKKEIDIQIIGIAASMAAIISQSRKDKKPKMVRNGFLMIHAPSGSTYGGALDHENNAKLLRSIEKTCVQLLSTSLSKPEKYVAKWMVGDNWFDAEEALQEGLISEIIEPESETITENLNPQELGAQAMYYQFSALLTDKENLKIKNVTTMKKPIIEALALVGVNEQSSDTAVIEAVKQHFEAKANGLQGKLDAEIKKRETAETALEAHAKTVITAILETAKKEGKITAEQILTYEGIAKASGLEALNTVLAAIPVRKPITGQMVNGKTDTAAGRETWGFDQWQKEDPKGFEALAKNDPETFQELLNAKYKK